jgi:hypothetical protein
MQLRPYVGLAPAFDQWVIEPVAEHTGHGSVERPTIVLSRIESIARFTRRSLRNGCSHKATKTT